MARSLTRSSPKALAQGALISGLTIVSPEFKTSQLSANPGTLEHDTRRHRFPFTFRFRFRFLSLVVLGVVLTANLGQGCTHRTVEIATAVYPRRIIPVPVTHVYSPFIVEPILTLHNLRGAT